VELKNHRKNHPWYQLVNSLDRAKYVKYLRCEAGCTWRAVAQYCSNEWQGDWGSHQIAGMYICETAADFLGEDASKEPWN